MPARESTAFPTLRPLALALSLAFAAGGIAHAQSAPAAPAAAAAEAPAAQDGLQLDRIVITGSTVMRSKFKQSVSVSQIDGEQVQWLQAAFNSN